ncbi:phosphoenolpyruvate-utilizing protein [Pseudonocardia sp. KRD-184]|uniref:Phosphoenolpyruvate-utilizing protein n=1 Tax=Pseudonocardia oceani TaxID=2792013 RepID=A0ABS6U416_9PSEU|nr:PEP-utilizing enzyme [Pseudonocardia oceani]MBW0091383.1 phosphoenolpyruvate-utilizing protein [Pseudonocardia oceani]MBW0096070.1 phosphoenolpyruvate-utilizing protein [Pseudonocardia oceani]MBW0121048.1 phosphoenolpyruvate-utilizing protein [Pseudonocardia oceani]MBW0126981.1 phosphoenolpyruvate-utilizing protein [Pseudonocardia oceani]
MTDWPIFDRTSKTFPLYSRANVGEIFPDPISPLNASIGFQANLEPGWEAAFVACRVWDHDIYDKTVDRNVLPAFGSYLYINMSLMRLFGVRVPGMGAEAVDLQYFGDMPGIPSYESEKRDFDDDPAFSEQAGGWLMNEVLLADDLGAYDADRADVRAVRESRPDLSALTDEQLVERLTSYADLQTRLFQHHIESSLKSGVGLGAIGQLAAAVGKPELGLTLVSGIGDVDSTGPSSGMWALSRNARTGAVAALFDAGVPGLYERIAASDDAAVVAFRAELDAFLADWDFRGPAEWELRADTWSLRPELALHTVDRMRGIGDDEAPQVKNAVRVQEREAATAVVRELLAGDAEALGQFEVALKAAALWLRGRERSRTTSAMLVHELRLPALELGRRGVEAGHLDDAKQVFMLFGDELPAYLADPGSFTEQVRTREKTYVELFDYEPPFVVVGEVPPLSEWKRRSDRTHTAAVVGETIQGVSGCTGVTRGRARVLTDPNDPSALEPGDILVAPITDPSWTPLFVAAAGVVVDVGAPFSHAAIVSRELGIPCVVSATDATGRIPDGALIEVDGTSATVTILEV